MHENQEDLENLVQLYFNKQAKPFVLLKNFVYP